MKTVSLLLGIHNHQPIGNFDWVFEHAWDRAYRPFLDVLKRFPAIKVSLHYTGPLIDWLRANRPELINDVRNMVRAGQVEIMGGSYYEAILSIIPDDDKSGQLLKLNGAVRKLFGTDPTGMWLAERVWEQHLARFIADAGLRYIVVDDTHFKYAGFSEHELLGYYETEEQGRRLSIFPISKTLRYTVPFQPVQKTIDYLRTIATEEGDHVAVYADDGEKFGVWPKTYDHVYRNGWLEDFFKALSDNGDWIRVVHFSEALARFQPLGRTYLPNASYAEMMHWSLPSHHFGLYEEFESLLKENGWLEKYESFFKGGFWRNFLAKYPETNNMHKKMLRVSGRARAVGRKRGAGARTSKALEHVWAAQCNDPYWHGVFGGLYLPILRYPVYRNLIDAERSLDRIEKISGVRTEMTDFDCDGRDELIVETPVLNCYVKPDAGGSVFELDFKPRSLNILDIVSRHEEGYHHRLQHATAPQAGGEVVASIHDLSLAKERDLDRYLHYDWYRRGSLIDHFFGPGTTLEQAWQCKYPELGDFVSKPYDVSVRREKSRTLVTLKRDGALWIQERAHPVSVEKIMYFEPRSAVLNVRYRIRNRVKTPVEVWFGIECNVGLQAGDALDRYYHTKDGSLDDPRLGSRGELRGIDELGLRDDWLKVDVRIATEAPTTFWRFPIETISLSEAGFERIFQSSVVLPHWKFRLEDEWNTRLRLSIHGITS